MNRAVGVGLMAGEVIHHFAAVAHKDNRTGDARAFEDVLEDEAVGVFVFRGEHGSVGGDKSGSGAHEGFGGTLRSSTQKWLPLPGVDSTPTRPPMRSTTLRTMARPMPVPSY